jgi:S1-C subfamily serine protease
MSLRVLAASLLLATILAEDLPKPDIPDPFGLGERLALIDHLRDQLHVTPPPGATYEQLVALYWRTVRPPSAQDTGDDATLARDRMLRLRGELTKLGISAPDDADEAALRAALEQGRNAHALRADAAIAAQADATRSDTLSASDLGNLRARLERAGSEARRLQERSAALDRQRTDTVARINALVERKQLLDGQAAAAVNELTRWQRAADAELKSAGVVAQTTRDAYDRAKERHTAALAAITAAAEEYHRLKDEHGRLGEEQQKLVERIAACDQERVRIGAQLAAAEQAAAAPAATTSGQSAAPGIDLRLRTAVVLVAVQGRGSGSGFFVDRSGLLITNAHVVGDGAAPMIALWDSAAKRQPARLRVLRIFADLDLALLRAEGVADIEPLTLNPAYDLSRPLLAVGFPLAADISRSLGTSPTDIVVTRGTLSAVRHKDDAVVWLQHDCRIASGNSGGPLIDQATGTVIGMNTQVLTPNDAGGAGDGLNFAIPAGAIRDHLVGLVK